MVMLDQKEAEVALHALVEERDRVIRKGGNQYGLMTIVELNNLIKKLQRGA